MTKRRILQFIEYKNITLQNFFVRTGIKRGFLDSDKLDQAVSDKHFTMIFAAFPEISPDWLLTGKGEMLRNGAQTPPDSPQQSNPMHVDIEAIKLLIEEKDRSIAALTTQIADLRIQLKIKDEQLAAKDVQLAAKDRMMCKLMGIEE